MIAPVGSNVRSFSTSADLSTRSRHLPLYVHFASHPCQNFTVCSNNSCASFSDVGHGTPAFVSSSLSVNTCDLPSSSGISAVTPPRSSRRNGTPAQRLRRYLLDLKVAPFLSSVVSCSARP